MTLRERYDALPDKAKDEMFDLLMQAIKCRGWARINSLSTRMRIEDICAVFQREQGVEFEEYT